LDRIAAALEALTAERESQRSSEPDHTQALADLAASVGQQHADLAASINRDRDQQQQRHSELIQAVTQAQGQGDAAGLPEVLAALRRLEEGRADWSSYDDEQLEGIKALTEALASLDALDELAAGLDELRAYDAQQLEGIKALAAALSSLDALDELAAGLDDLRAYNAQHLEAVKELAASLVPLESVVDRLVAAQDADKDLIDKLRDLLTPMARLSFAIQAGEKDPLTGWRALIDKVKKLPG
jgi:hypothetical protein